MTPNTAGASASNGKLRFDVYQVDPHAGELRKHGYRIRLEDRPFRALLVLLCHANEVVTREELQKQLWPADVFVDFDHGLNTAIAKIRRALNDSADQPRFVETVGRRGYRFMVEVTTEPKAVSSNGRSSHIFSEGDELAANNGVVLRVPPPVSAPASISGSTLPLFARKRTSWRLVLAVLAATGLVVVGSLAAYRLGVQLPALPFNAQLMRTRQVTENGMARYANISPDGRYIVYVKSTGSGPGMWARQIATGSDVVVVPPRNGSFLSTISFSPDSNHVFFGHNSPENAGLFDLYTIPVLGGEVQRVLSDIAGASVSPDGAQVAFVRRDPVKARTMLMVAKSDGSQQKELAARGTKNGFMGDMPAWSPDGRLLAVVAIHDGNEAVREIVVVPVAGGEPHTLLGRRTFGQLTWLNNEGLVVASFDFSAGFSPGSDRAQLYYQPFPSGEAVRFSNDMNHYTQVGITADRDRLVSVKQDMSNGVSVAPIANPASMRHITGEKIAGFDLDWIGNDRLVVEDENYHVYTMNADGSNHIVLFDKFSANFLNHCGDHAIVFNRIDSNNSVSLSVLDLWDGSLRVLAKGSFNMGGSCSRDGSWVYYTAFDATPVRLMKIPFSGGQAVRVGPPASQDPLVRPMVSCCCFVPRKGKEAPATFSGRSCARVTVPFFASGRSRAPPAGYPGDQMPRVLSTLAESTMKSRSASSVLTEGRQSG
jgi:DNA-binding winged helix-turn-helix (wHTH) protein